MMWHYGSLASPDFQFPMEFRSSELACTPTYTLANPLDAHIYGSTLNEPLQPDSNRERALASWGRAHNAATAVHSGSDYNEIMVSTEHSPHQGQVFQNQNAVNGAANGHSTPASAISDWGHNQIASAAWTPTHQVHNPFDANSLLLQQAPPSVQGQAIHPPQVLDGTLYDLYPTSSETQYPINIPQPDHNSPSEPVKQGSRGNSPFAISPPQLPEEAFAHRRSDSSELVNTFDTIHIQKQRSQQNSDEEVFKTPAVPSLSIAARRKRPRPTPLGTGELRSHSFTKTQTVSPGMKTSTLGPSRSVRRIKSTGNSLNVMSGRVQKSGLSSAQRSPLNFQTFHEAGAFDQIQCLSRQGTDTTQRSCSFGSDPLTPLSPSTLDNSASDWDKAVMHSNSDPPFVPSNQQLMSNSYDGLTGVTSPPISPFVTTPVHTTPFSHHYMSPPQSAPPQLTTFPNVSPHFHSQQAALPSYMGSHATLPEQYAYYAPAPVQQAQPPAMMGFDGHSGIFVPSNQQYVDHSPPLGGHSVFYANPAPPPQKEMEFVLQTFPEPKGAQQAPKEQQQPKDYIFQNTGPNDFQFP